MQPHPSRRKLVPRIATETIVVIDAIETAFEMAVGTMIGTAKDEIVAKINEDGRRMLMETRR